MSHFLFFILIFFSNKAVSNETQVQDRANQNSVFNFTQNDFETFPSGFKTVILSGQPDSYRSGAVVALSFLGYIVEANAQEDYSKVFKADDSKSTEQLKAHINQVAELYDFREENNQSCADFQDGSIIDTALEWDSSQAESILSYPCYQRLSNRCPRNFYSKIFLFASKHKSKDLKTLSEYRKIGYQVIVIPQSSLVESIGLILKELSHAQSLDQRGLINSTNLTLKENTRNFYFKPNQISFKPSGFEGVVLSGGPGTGKTSVLLALSFLGYRVSREAASEYILFRKAQGCLLPWNDRNFKSQVTELCEFKEAKLLSQPVHFQDRSILDAIGFFRFHRQEIPDSLKMKLQTLELGKRYFKVVFILDSLGQIELDGSRVETLEESIKIAEYLEKVYKEMGYRIVHVPKMSLKKRVNFILTAIHDEF